MAYGQKQVETIIATGQLVSSAFQLEGRIPVAIAMPLGVSEFGHNKLDVEVTNDPNEGWNKFYNLVGTNWVQCVVQLKDGNELLTPQAIVVGIPREHMVGVHTFRYMRFVIDEDMMPTPRGTPTTFVVSLALANLSG